MKLELLMLVPLLLLAVLFQFTPLLTRRGIFFGATVDPDFPQSSDGRRLLRSYRWRVALVSLAAILLSLIFFPVFSLEHPAFVGVAPLLLLLGTAFSYWRNFREIHARYGLRKPEIRATSLSASPANHDFSLWLILPPLAALAAVAVYLGMHWNELPPRYPVHWGLDGQPNGWANRDWRGVYGPLMFAAYLDAVTLALAWIISHESRKTAMRYVTVRVLQFVAYPLTFVFLIVPPLPLSRFVPAWLVAGVLFASIGGLIYWSYQKITAPSEEDEVPEPQNDAYWKAGAFYWNPDDPAIFVSKRVGIGYTMNFANKWSWLTMAAILAALVVPIFFH